MFLFVEGIIGYSYCREVGFGSMCVLGYFSVFLFIAWTLFDFVVSELRFRVFLFCFSD